MIRGGTTVNLLSHTFVEYGNEKPLEVLSSMRSMAVLSSRAQERRSHEKFAREAPENERPSREKNKLLSLQPPRGFSALARLYYLVRPTKTAMLRRLSAVGNPQAL